MSNQKAELLPARRTVLAALAALVAMPAAGQEEPTLSSSMAGIAVGFATPQPEYRCPVHGPLSPNGEVFTCVRRDQRDQVCGLCLLDLVVASLPRLEAL